jgi:hypothetical protein
MGKKKAGKKTAPTEFEHPEYEKLTTVEQVDAEVEKHKTILVGKDKTESQIKANKKEYVKSMNEQLKELNQEREHEIGVLGALDDRRRQINASNVIPIMRQV